MIEELSLGGRGRLREGEERVYKFFVLVGGAAGIGPDWLDVLSFYFLEFGVGSDFYFFFFFFSLRINYTEIHCTIAVYNLSLYKRKGKERKEKKKLFSII